MRRLLDGNGLVAAILAVAVVVSIGACGGDPGEHGTGGSGGMVAGGTGGGTGGTGGDGGSGGAGGDGGTGATGGTGGTGGEGGTGGGGGSCTSHLQCPLDRPECTPSGCAPCTSEVACEGRGHCDPDSGACVECVDNAHCAEGVECIDNVCVECTRNADCPSGVCNIFSKCEPPTACQNGGCPLSTLACYPGDNECWPVCDPLGNPTCHDGYGCGFWIDEQDELRWACIPDTGTAGLNEPCDPGNGILCSVSLFCSQEPVGRLCRAFCDPNDPEWDCGEGLECVAFGDVPELGFCRVPIRECQSDADCEEGEHCRLGRAECYPNVGTKAAGEPCQTNEECASGACYTDVKVCAGMCESTADCYPGSACVLLDFGAFISHSCVPACTTDADCAEDLFCAWAPEPPDYPLSTVCLGRAVGEREAGESCANGAQCRSGICRGAPNGYCLGVCATADDCADDRLECRDDALFDGNGFLGAVPMCVGHLCAKEADCMGGWSCQLEDEGDPWTMVARCMPPVGTKVGGQSCVSHAECRTGFCAGGEFGCFELCETDLDCPTGLCEHGLILNYRGVQFVISACVNP